MYVRGHFWLDKQTCRVFVQCLLRVERGREERERVHVIGSFPGDCYARREKTSRVLSFISEIW